MSSCRKIHNSYKFEEAFNLVSKSVSCEQISMNSIYTTVWNITYMAEQDRNVDLIALFNISNGLATFFIFR